MPKEPIRQHRDGDVLVLTLDAPERRNALDGPMMTRLSELLRDNDGEVGAIVLAAADPAFCAGLDLREVGTKGIRPEAVTEAKQSPWLQLAGMDTPVIGAVNGAAITGGLELVLQCTFLVASETRFRAACSLQPSAAATSASTRLTVPKSSLDA